MKDERADQPALLSAKEAAEYLGCSVRHLRRLAIATEPMPSRGDAKRPRRGYRLVDLDACVAAPASRRSVVEQHPVDLGESRPRKPRQPQITVHVVRSEEVIDLDAWAQLFVRTVLTAHARELANKAVASPSTVRDSDGAREDVEPEDPLEGEEDPPPKRGRGR